MGNIFLGKRSHWALITLMILVFYVLGTFRLHVTHFNSFTILLLILILFLLLSLRWTTSENDKITRDD